MKSRIFWVFASLLGLANSAFAQTSAGLPGGFLRTGAGTRALAMGGAFSAVANDPSAGYWNPAGLTQLPSFQFSASYAQMSLDRTFNFVSAASPLGAKTALGVSWIGFGVQDVEGRDGNTETPDFLFSNQNNALLLSVSRKINSFLSAGVSTKLILQKLNEQTSFGTGFDVSLLTRPTERIQVGFSVQDIAASAKWSSEFNENYPLTLRGGVAFNIGNQVLLAADVFKTGQADPELAFGAEFSAAQKFPIRVGYSAQGVVGGAGVALPMESVDLAFDYAFGKDALDGGQTHRFSLGIALAKPKSSRSEISGADIGKSTDLTDVYTNPKRMKKARRQTNDVWLEVQARGLNVRTGAGVKHKKIAIIRQGQRFKKVGMKGYWYKIQLENGKRGWVHHKYMKEVEDANL